MLLSVATAGFLAARRSGSGWRAGMGGRQSGYAPLKKPNVGQQVPTDPRRVRRPRPVECVAKGGGLGAQLAAGQLSQHRRVRLAAEERPEHVSATQAEY